MNTCLLDHIPQVLILSEESHKNINISIKAKNSNEDCYWFIKDYKILRTELHLKHLIGWKQKIKY